MAAYLMAVVSSIPNTAVRCRGSAPWVRASSSCRSTRSRSRVAVRPRHDPVSQFSLTARVVVAVCWLMIRWGLAVPGQRRPRCCSQARSRFLVRSSSGRGVPAMTSRRLPRSMSPRCSSRMALGLAAWTAASATARRAAGVTAADAAWSISAGCSGWMRISGTLAVAEAAGGVAEDRAGLLAVAEQRAQGGEGLPAQAAVQRFGGGGDVACGDFAQVSVVSGPFQQQRVNPVEVHPDGVLVAGAAAGPALAAGAQPVPDVGGHRLRQQREPRLRQGGEGRDPVVVQEPGEGEDLGGAGDAEVPAAQGRRQLGPGDHVPGLALGEHDGQRAAGLGDDPVVPAAGAGQVRGDAPGLLQGRAGDRRGGPVALVEVQRLTGRAQLQLGPAGRGGRRGGTVRRGLPGRAGAAQAAHARQRQLPVAGGLEVFRRKPPPARGGDAGLQPAQPAVALLDRDDPPAAGALAAAIAAGEVIAGPAVRPRAVGGSPGQAVRAAADRGGGPDPRGHQAGGSERPSRRLGVTAGPACGAAAACSSCCSPAAWPLLTGSGISSSSTPQPTTAQMTSRSSSLMLAGRPDHRPDIFPALILRPAPASIRCSSLAVQMPRLAAASRRFHFTAPVPSARPAARCWPAIQASST